MYILVYVNVYFNKKREEGEDEGEDEHRRYKCESATTKIQKNYPILSFSICLPPP